jgi:hypothetical protein
MTQGPEYGHTLPSQALSCEDVLGEQAQCGCYPKAHFPVLPQLIGGVVLEVHGHQAASSAAEGAPFDRKSFPGCGQHPNHLLQSSRKKAPHVPLRLCCSALSRPPVTKWLDTSSGRSLGIRVAELPWRAGG